MGVGWVCSPGKWRSVYRLSLLINTAHDSTKLAGAIKCLEVKNGRGQGFEWGGEKEQGVILHLSVVGFKKSIDDVKIYRLQYRFNT